MLFSYIIGPKYGGGTGNRNQICKLQIYRNKPLYDTPIIKRQQVILTFIITQLNDLYSCESVLKVFLGEEFVVYFERVEGIEPSSLNWKSNIIIHYTTPANLGRIRRVLSTETSSLISYLIRAF
jgi:hypothetical protein